MASAVTSLGGNCVLSNLPSHGDPGWGKIPWGRYLSIHVRPVACRANHSWFHGASGRTGTDPLGLQWGTWCFSAISLPFDSFFRQTQGESLSIPGPSLLPPRSSILLFLLLFFFSFLSSISWIMIQISIQDKNVFYFTLSAVIKFCPQQGHCRFHGNQYTLKLRRMTV